jgi:hypothetical protein
MADAAPDLDHTLPAPPPSNVSYPPEPIRSYSPSPSDSDYESSSSHSDTAPRSRKDGKGQHKRNGEDTRRESEIGLLGTTGSTSVSAKFPSAGWFKEFGRVNEGFLLIGASQAAFAAINTLVKILGERSSVPVRCFGLDRS